MPRKSKKKAFKGTPWWDKSKRVGTDSAGSSSATDDSAMHITSPSSSSSSTSGSTDEAMSRGTETESNAPSVVSLELLSDASEPSDVGLCSHLVTEETISEKKLKRQVNENASGQVQDTAEEATGYRLIHLDGLQAAVNDLHRCETGYVTLKEDQQRRHGFSSLLYFECSECHVKTHLQTSKHERSSASPWKPTDSSDINRRVTFASSEIGLGRDSVNMLADIMDMPHCVTTRSWNDNVKLSLVAAKDEVSQKLQQSRLRVRERLQQDNPEITDDTVIDVPVSFDGTWSKRGFTANYGVAFAMSIDTGEVIDFSMKSKFCTQCATSSLAKDSDEYTQWYESHKSSCSKNFEGSSGAMERECAKDLWGASLQHGMRYKYMICDGDSKAYNDVWDIYGVCSDCEQYEKMDRKSAEYSKWVSSDDYVKWKDSHDFGEAQCNRVVKLDCVGHVQKRMGKALRELKKKGGKLDDGKAIGGRGHRLTDGTMEKLQLYYGRAIRSSTADVTASREEMERNLQKMKEAILAVLHHSVINDEDAVRHKYCPDGDESWCSFKKTGQKIPDKPHHLDPVFLTFLLPIFERLSDTSLLRRCLPGFSQNQNESINSLVWLRAPKHKHRGAATTELAVILAIMQFNEGSTGKHGLMERLGIHPGVHSLAGSAKKDSLRVKKARRAAEINTKARREKRRQAQKMLDEELRRQEGVSYSSGAFNELDVLADTSKGPKNKRKGRSSDQDKSKAAKSAKKGKNNSVYENNTVGQLQSRFSQNVEICTENPKT